MAEERYCVVLAKEDFKFSAAHFTLFLDREPELLHGHNYRVELELSGSRLNQAGLLLDLAHAKRAIRAICRRLDERTLIPEASELLHVRRTGDGVEVELGTRHYRFPFQDAVLLPLANTSMELLARQIWRELAAELKDTLVERLGVVVEESAGQRCRYEAVLKQQEHHDAPS